MPSRSVVACSLILTLVGCGSSGGGGGGGAPSTQTILIPGETPIDGWVASDGSFSATICGQTGDLDFIQNGVGYRQLFSFNLGTLSSQTVVSATLAIWAGMKGGLDTHGDVIIDHLDYGPQINALDYGIAALTGNIGAPRDLIGTNLGSTYWYLDVTPYVQADLAAMRVRTQYRARMENFDSDFDNLNDWIQLGLDGCLGREPLLIVELQ